MDLDGIYGKLRQVGDCWEWQGAASSRTGHGQVWFAGRNQSVYRVIWSDLRGEIPEGLELDHLCRNPPCCNPAHLEPVTHAENQRRGGLLVGKTRCKNGHDLIEVGVYIYPSGKRNCRECKRIHRRESERRRRTRA